MNEKLFKDVSLAISNDEKNCKKAILDYNLMQINESDTKNRFETIYKRNSVQFNDENINLNFAKGNHTVNRSFSNDLHRNQHDLKGKVNHRVIKLYSLSPQKRSNEDKKTRNSYDQHFKGNHNTKDNNTKSTIVNNSTQINSIINKLTFSINNISTKNHKKTKSYASNSINPINLNYSNQNEGNNLGSNF